MSMPLCSLLEPALQSQNMVLSDRASIGQISSLRLTSPVEKVYCSVGLGSKHQGQSEPTSTKYPEEFGKER